MLEKQRIFVLRIVSCVVLLLVFTQGAVGQGADDAKNIARALSQAFEDAAKKVTPSLVSISTLKRLQNAQFGGGDPRLEHFRDFLGNELFERYFGQVPPQARNRQNAPDGLQPHGMGSGFIISTDGYILTNNHVVDGADELLVRLNDKREVKAEVVGTDPQTDIAVIKIEANAIEAAQLGDSATLGIGEWVLAAGNPFGLDRSITAGIVSARGRAISAGDKYENYIQTDAAINVGNSGGPLVNLDGEVVGINTMILSRSGGNQGIGFAIPINMAKNISQQLIEHGSVSRGWLGIAIQDLTEDLKRSFDFEGDGVLVGDVNPKGPADNGGLKPGDIILSVAGVPTHNANDLRNSIAATKPGTTVELAVLRSGKKRTLSIVLGEREPSQAGISALGERSSTSKSSELGMQLEDLSDALRSRFSIDSEGVVLVVGVQPYSSAYKAGIRKGDVILQVGDTKVTSVKQLLSLLDDDSIRRGVRIVLENDGMKRFAVVKK